MLYKKDVEAPPSVRKEEVRAILDRIAHQIGPEYKISLIKELREKTGLSLIDAKHEVDLYFLHREADALAIDLERVVADALKAEERDGRKPRMLKVMKAVRADTGLGMIESRLAVEEYLAKRRPEMVRQLPGCFPLAFLFRG